MDIIVTIVFVAISVISIIQGGGMETMWMMINALQIVHFIPMMTLFFPTHARVVFGYVAIANLDNYFLA